MDDSLLGPEGRGPPVLLSRLAALASPSRVELLRQLQVPRILRDLRVPPTPARRGRAGSEERSIARQNVRKHLDCLVAAGFVSRLPGDEASARYVVNAQRLFGLMEEIREIARIRPAGEWILQPTDAAEVPSASPLAGPHLVVVKGLHEGASIDLTPAASRPRTWRIGRRRDSEIPLDYDPFVSRDNSVLRWSGREFEIESLLASTNGTALNFRPLVPGRPAPLRHGDVISVGRTTLVFRHPAGADP